LIKNDGYLVKVNRSKFEAGILKGHDILVIANAMNEKNSGKGKGKPPHFPAFTSDEITAVWKWVKRGGSLFLIADHQPWGGAAYDLAEKFGVILSKGTAVDSYKKEKYDSYDDGVYSIENGKLLDHPIVKGRDETEKLSRVKTHLGESMQVPKGSGFLKFGKYAYDIHPVTKEERPIPDHFQGAGFAYGKGRVVVMGEAACMSVQYLGAVTADGPVRWDSGTGYNTPGMENKQLVLNIMHYLSGLLEPGITLSEKK